jgi:hypothetical protein
MGILVIITMISPKSFQIIIHHRLNSILESFFPLLFVCILLFILHPFNVFVYLYIVVNFSNELDFHLHFA